jgi:hypothetical protein
MVQQVNNKTLKMIIKVVIFILLVWLIYKLTDDNQSIESFINKKNQEHKEYIRYSETLLDNKDQSLKDLYKNYSGTGNKKEEWTNMNLHQCIDRCNEMEGCIGFSRENVNDDEKANCFPKSILSQCHSSRKGNFEQRQKSLDYNTFIKVGTKNQLTKCIGDEAVTMDRNIFIKSYAHPNKYVGIKNNKVELITKGPKQIGIFLYCKFKVEVGKEGNGTISFKHVESGKYLCRNKDNLIDCQKLDNSTNTKQRCSFFLHDGLSNQVILKCHPLQGEKLSRYISVDRNGKYLRAVDKSELNKRNKFMELMTFDLIDFMTQNTIVTSKQHFRDLSKDKKRENFNDVNEHVDIQNNEKIIEKETMDLYKYLESGIHNFNNRDQDSQPIRQIDIAHYQTLSDIDAHFNKTIDEKRYDDESHGKDTYLKLRAINDNLYEDKLGIEKKLKGLNNRIENSKLELDKLKLRDMSRDYNYLKTLLDETKTPTSNNPPQVIEELLENQPESVLLN